MLFMTFWERLGIDRTGDIKVIRRAYAKQLKIYHPEDDPAGYQALREAFDMAMSYAKRQVAMEEEDTPSEDWMEAEQLPSPDQTVLDYSVPDSHWYDLDSDASSQADVPDPSPPPHTEAYENVPLPLRSISTVEAFLLQAAFLYDDFPSRISLEKWIELLDADIMWNIDTKQTIAFQLLKFIQSHRYLPAEIWQLLEGSFDWLRLMQDSELFDDDSTIASFLPYYKRQLASPGLRYQFLLNAEGVDIDKFLHNRDEGHKALIREDSRNAKIYLRLAYDIFPDDPDLLRLLGELYLHEGDPKNALEIFERLITLMPEKLDGYLYVVQIYKGIGRTALIHNDLKKARLVLSQAYKLSQDDPDLLRLLGELYLREQDTVRALEMFERLTQLLPDDIESYLYRARIWRDSGQPERTVEECRLLLSRWPNRPEITILMSQALHKLGHYDEATACLNQEMGSASSSVQRVPAVDASSVRSAKRRHWKLFINRPILLNLAFALVLALTSITCLYYFRENVHTRTPAIIEGPEQLITMDEQRYAELRISNIEDLHMGKYITSGGDTVYQNEDFAFIHFDDYKRVDGKIYMADFFDKKLLLIAPPSVGFQEEQGQISIKGYVHQADADMESKAGKMLQWKPVHPAGSTERMLESYQMDLRTRSKSSPEDSVAAVPEFQSVYFEVSKPQVRSEFTFPNLLFIVFVLSLWLYVVYRLVFEYRKVGMLITIIELRGQQHDAG